MLVEINKTTFARDITFYSRLNIKLIEVQRVNELSTYLQRSSVHNKGRGCTVAMTWNKSYSLLAIITKYDFQIREFGFLYQALLRFL